MKLASSSERSPRATPPEAIELIIDLRGALLAAGDDAGAESIRWHLDTQHDVVLSAATISRYLHTAALITPQLHKRSCAITSSSEPVGGVQA